MDTLMDNKDKQIITIVKTVCLAFFEEVFDQNVDERNMIQDTKNPDMCLAFMNKCYDGDLGLDGLGNVQVQVHGNGMERPRDEGGIGACKGYGRSLGECDAC